MILYVLGDIDIESAYRLLENEEMPGWLFMPKSGAATIWEKPGGHTCSEWYWTARKFQTRKNPRLKILYL